MKPSTLPSGCAIACPSLLAATDLQGQYDIADHITAIDDALLDVAHGSCRRLIVTMPPRHGKSTMVSEYFPAWYLARNAGKSVILSSYEAEFAARWGARARDVLRRQGAAFGVKLKGEKESGWSLSNGSEMHTAGVGGAITGKGADVFIIDDPVKNAEEAASETMRRKTWDWFQSVAYTRLSPRGSIITIMTRWHEDDLVGRLLKAMQDGGESYRLIEMPAIDARGAALWPDRFPLQRLDEIKRTVGAYYWSALYQQRPAPAEGGVIQRKWFRYARQEDMLAGNWRRFTTVDLATSERTMADNTVMATWAYEPSLKKLVLIDLFADRVDSPTVIRMAHTIMQRHGVEAFWVEQVAYQLSMIQHMRAAGIPVRTIKPTKDKVSRAQTANPFWEAGQVYFLAGAHWLDELEHELLSFPNAKHDDRVDAVTYGILVAFRQALLGETRQLR